MQAVQPHMAAGENGFDDKKDICALRPLNGYGYSKQLFDLWEREQVLRPKQYVGFKYFNVYGPNEYFKGSMASVIFHTFNKIKETGEMVYLNLIDRIMKMDSSCEILSMLRIFASCKIYD